MILAMLEVKLFKTNATETDREAFIGLGVELNRFNVSTTHLAHETHEGLHYVGGGLSVLRVQIVKDLLEVVDGDLLLEELNLVLLGLDLRLDLLDLGSTCVDLLLKLLIGFP